MSDDLKTDVPGGPWRVCPAPACKAYNKLVNADCHRCGCPLTEEGKDEIK